MSSCSRTHLVTAKDSAAAFAAFLVGCAVLLTACETKSVDPPQGEEASSSSEKEVEKQAPPPPFELTTDMDEVLYTWVDADGNFQLTEDRQSIPEGSRDMVRVVAEDHPTGTPSHVYVADLRSAKAGRYDLKTITRNEWEKQGAASRKKMLAQLQPPAEDLPEGKLDVSAIVYGASWCKPCHQAEAYLKKKGADVVKKDVEENPAAAKEMRRKLERTGMTGSSIPIIDVGGTVMVGFSPRAIDAALARASRN